MEEPNREVIEALLKSTHFDDVPNWTTKEKLEAYEQLKRLYEHWFRKQI